MVLGKRRIKSYRCNRKLEGEGRGKILKIDLA
jgi:hypothetical protein